MRSLVYVLACIAIAMPAGLGGGGDPDPDSPTCRASLEGDLLVTGIDFPGGYSVEGPWTVLDSHRTARDDGAQGQLLTAVLDRIVEVQNTGQRVESSFPSPIETTFEGRDDAELVQRAAEVWCVVVMKAQGHMRSIPPAEQAPIRMAMLDRPFG
jgi:hypothetical protein